MHRTYVRTIAASLALPLVAAACSDRPTLPLEEVPEAPPPSQQMALVTCHGDVGAGTLECGPAAGPSAGGAAFDQRIVGGQGRYVRLTSSGVSYAADVFAFNVTVQNLLTSPMATADGTTRHAAGVRVFFAEAPTATGGTGSISVMNATGVGTFTEAGQPYFQYGGEIGGSDQPELGADGILSSAEVSSAKNWQLNIPASVTTFSFTLMVAAETPAGAIVSAAPQITGVSPATLTPGTSATLTGVNFNPTPASNTVTINGRAATVTAATATSLTVTVPCVSSGSVPVVAATGGMTGAAYSHPLAVTQRNVPLGEMVVVSSDVGCNEIASANGPARYVVSVFSNSTSPSSNSAFQISGDQPGADGAQDALPAPAGNQLVAPRLPLARQVELAAQLRADETHHRLLEQNAEMYRQLRAEFGAGNRPTPLRPNRNVVNADPPLTRTFRVSNINATSPNTICSSFYVVSATRVYYDGKIAIYEDDATPDAFKASLNATMASNYQRIGDQFNADMEPIVRNYFGDVLRRDAVTDNDGLLIALFTPRLNNSFPGVAGFVVSCDQFPNNDTNPTPAPGGPYTGSAGSSNAASNFGEFFYAYQPAVAGTGYSGNTAENWYRTIRSTFIHETKHVASQAARVANNAPSYEASWLEEGTARHVEELWGRVAVDNIPWKGNTGYGSAANPINYYCDSRPSGFAECSANTRRPANIMQRHFSSLYTHLFGTNARLLSPFGATASDNASYFYAISWSLVRYAVDRHAADEAAFFTALTDATTTGMTNVNARLGTTTDQLLAGWTLSLAVDDHPLWGATTPSNDVLSQTWNYRNIYNGMNADFPSTYTLAYPLVPAARSFGTFATTSFTTLRGGGSLWFEFSGTQSAPQLIRLEANGGAAVPSTVRMAITRVQ